MNDEMKDLVRSDSDAILHSSGYVYRGRGVWERLSPLEIAIQRKREERHAAAVRAYNHPWNRFLRFIGVRS